MARNQEKINLGRVIIYGDPNYKYMDETGWTKDENPARPTTCEVLDVQEITKDRVITYKHILPLEDATVHNSDEGLVYSYNCSLDYLAETAHLAEVEQNTIISQAFLYAGRNTQANKTPAMLWLLVGLMGLLSIIGMIK